MKRLIAFISILLFITAAVATPVSVTIWGDGKSQAATNYTFTTTGANNSLNVLTWNLTYGKTWMLNSSNASGDVVTFNISNITAYRVVELKVNGTVINGYQATVNGMVNFTYNSSNNSNKTYSIAPASNIASGNQTWVKTWNGGGQLITATFNRSYVKDTVYQNTNSSAMFITTTAYAAASGESGCNYRTGTTNPPMEMVGSYAETTSEMHSFWVLPNEYFGAFSSSGTCTIVRWSVWQ